MLDPWERWIVEAEMRASELGPPVIIGLLLLLILVWNGKRPKEDEERADTP